MLKVGTRTDLGINRVQGARDLNRFVMFKFTEHEA